LVLGCWTLGASHPIYFSPIPGEIRTEKNFMEVYFKQLISKEASLEKLVEDLERVVQGADDFAKSLGVDLAEPRSDIARRLQHLKARCQRIKLEIIAQAKATDRLVRKHPYSFIAAAVALGMFLGCNLRRNR
jgi:ElaB/YqjD/DUF883 family membrane-anchored ribosome-binding protein